MVHNFLGGGVLIAHDALPLDGVETQEFISACECNGEPYNPETTGIGFRFRPNDPNGVTPSRFFVPSHHIHDTWDNHIYDCVVAYCAHFPEAIPSIQWTFNGHLLSYENQQHIGWHTDNLIARYPPEKFGFAPESQFAMHLTLSALLYLNDDYTGGEIEWKYPPMSYKPRTGDIVIYPSSFMGAHRVMPCQGHRRAYLKFYGHGYPLHHDANHLQWLPTLREDVRQCAS